MVQTYLSSFFFKGRRFFLNILVKIDRFWHFYKYHINTQNELKSSRPSIADLSEEFFLNYSFCTRKHQGDVTNVKGDVMVLFLTCLKKPLNVFESTIWHVESILWPNRLLGNFFYIAIRCVFLAFLVPKISIVERAAMALSAKKSIKGRAILNAPITRPRAMAPAI